MRPAGEGSRNGSCSFEVPSLADGSHGTLPGACRSAARSSRSALFWRAVGVDPMKKSAIKFDSLARRGYLTSSIARPVMAAVRNVIKGGIDRGRRCGQRAGFGSFRGRISRYRLRACRLASYLCELRQGVGQWLPWQFGSIRNCGSPLTLVFRTTSARVRRARSFGARPTARRSGKVPMPGLKDRLADAGYGLGWSVVCRLPESRAQSAFRLTFRASR